MEGEVLRDNEETNPEARTLATTIVSAITSRVQSANRSTALPVLRTRNRADVVRINKRVGVDQRVAMVMEYVHVRTGDWPLNVKIMMKHGWTSYDDFARFVNTYRHVGFHVKHNRDQIRVAAEGLRGPAPYARRTRFEEDDFFVHLGNDVLDGHLSQVLTAMDLPDRMSERSGVRSFASDGSSASDTQFRNLSDAKRAFDVAFAKLAGLLRLTDPKTMVASGIYCRETFEAEFQLEWTEKH
ncbi:hypothetical protein KM043_016461 [Ampulex compressa]|nr:hypothetical protein KM043_016461 [Ampulex compressa]